MPKQFTAREPLDALGERQARQLAHASTRLLTQ